MNFNTIYQLILEQAQHHSNAIAMIDPDISSLTYGHLHAQVCQVIQQLNNMGIGRHDRVACVMPNGIGMAVTFLAIAAGATSAPLNPAYTKQEFVFFLKDLNAKALVVHPALDSPARAVAHAEGIPVIEFSPLWDDETELFTLSGSPLDVSSAPSTPEQFAQDDDLALVLYTSGTTSRPKMVPLTHRNICSSAHCIAKTLRLTETDRCLNIMPLFHIHGLIGAALSTFVTGGSLVCTPGFDSKRFFDWIETFQPTWYTAVPTMHQAVLTSASMQERIIASTSLRFIRSSSASLPPQVMTDIEQLFHVPVIESYGMTEASHQMTSNPLPPDSRKPGSVGIPAGPEVAVMDETSSNLLLSGDVGEVVIRGASVTSGYVNASEANQKAFPNGWFRTGDQGYFDADGYLFITGRLKEIINRGGEKIVPREVDEILLAHPAVAQAVTFAVPHATLGEDVAAAVILQDDVILSRTTREKDLREFLFDQLADYKVPTQILLIDEIPKGPTGKLQRIGLAEKLTHLLTPEFIVPVDPIEEELARIWAAVLRKERVGLLDNFFLLGGDSLTATQVVARMRVAFGVEFPVPMIFHEPILTDQASIIEDMLLSEVEELTEEGALRLID